MKASEVARTSSPKKPAAGIRTGAGQTVSQSQGKKPIGPMTYSVSKGSNVFWSNKAGRKA